MVSMVILHTVTMEFYIIIIIIIEVNINKAKLLQCPPQSNNHRTVIAMRSHVPAIPPALPREWLF